MTTDSNSDTAAVSPGNDLLARPSTGVETYKLGTWLFLASEVMLFTGLVGSYVVLRLGSNVWPEAGTVLDVPVLAVNTFLLICSSVTMVLALESARSGSRTGLISNLFWTIFLGCTFLSIKAYDYGHLFHAGVKPSTSLLGACYYTLTGFHGLHVTGGVITLTVLLVMALRGRFGPGDDTAIECAGLYWHFVDIVWIVLFAILCLL